MTKAAQAEAVQMLDGSKQATNLPVVMTPMGMLEKAIVAGSSMEVVEKLMELQERWEARQARKAFDNAMAAAKAEIPVIKKNRHVGFKSERTQKDTDYDHEDMGEIARTVDPILAAHGLSYRFRTLSGQGAVTVTCVVSHKDGHSEENPLTAGHDGSGGKNPIQALGSALTYLQRYSLKAALGLASAPDDDGKSSDDRKPRAPVPSASGKIEPYAISTDGVKFPAWAATYKAAIAKAESAEELTQWDKMNSKALDQIDAQQKPLYIEIEKVASTRLAELQTGKSEGPHGTDKYRPGDTVRTTSDPISTGPIKKARPGIPDIHTDYDGWVKWAFARIAKIEDGGELESFYNAEIEGFRSDVFPSDLTDLTAAYARAQTKMKADE